MAKKSPLRSTARSTAQSNGPAKKRTAKSPEREAMLSDFTLHLRASTNRSGRPYQERTITTYADAVVSLDAWMAQTGREGDFLSVEVADLNSYFRWYWTTYDKPQGNGYTGGTNTKQRNLRHLFTWLEEEYEKPHPYKSNELKKFNAPDQGKPKTLASDFIGDLLKATGGGHPRVRDFERTRDHAIIRVLTEGVRAEELLSLRVDSLLLDQGLAQVVPLKDARSSKEGRVVPLQPRTVIALKRYLRARDHHKLYASEWLWLGTRNRGHLKYSGLYRMLNRRADQSGYEQVSPHQFRHTFTDDLLSAGVSGEDVMTAAGWKDPSMLRRYAADMATNRAVKAIQGMGDRY